MSTDGLILRPPGPDDGTAVRAAQAFVIARSYGVRDALLIADDGNVASIAVIEARGGRLDPDRPADELHGRPLRHYLVPVS